ncbi:amine oxidase catalytic domain-containing protein [Tuber magnatum]|uniref:Amine oxidase n=1 Tax=Tuber magnatum TaxID=42249 RepID=A0A317SFV4_9PEZI|nr:amine oxidase catalytic domain-containing protein [Tuber magnatum]
MVRLGGILASLAVITSELVVHAAPDGFPRLNPRSTHLYPRQGNCTAPSNPSVTAAKPNPWKPLSNAETIDLLAWLHDPAQGLNLTAFEEATTWDNWVGVTELLAPNKTDVLAYLDGSGPAPKRYARVVISYSATENPYLQEYMVGPIPIVQSVTKIEPLNYLYNKGEGKSPNYSADGGAQRAWLGLIAANMSDITLDLLGTDYRNSSLWGIDPLWEENGRIISWTQFWSYPTGSYDSSTLLPQGLYLKIDITGRDWQGWRLLNILYDNKLYKSVDEFRAAWMSPGFRKLAKQVDGQWTGTDQAGTAPPLDMGSPPIQIQPDGQRFAVDKDAKYVEWMDFAFYIGFRRDTGVNLYDIKYKGKRIIYELGLQEALAHYAGNDPTQSGTAYLDSYYGFGPYVFELVPGYDCPAYSTFLDSAVHEIGNTTTNKNSICLFEHDAGYPLRRHTSTSYVSVTRNTIFTLRFMATIGNYDYNFDYNFHLDGSIEIKVRASGYIQSAFYAHNEDYGYQIHDATSGSMHDHVLNFKADLDILGTKNTFEKVSIVPTTAEYVWSTSPRNTMRVERSSVKNEDEGKINWAANGAAMYVVVNKDQPNKFGSSPGYRIMPGTGTPIHLTVQNSSNLQKAAEFATHHLYVTKQKDTEQHSAAAANSMNPKDPLVNFGKFFDGEPLLQEDIVVWFNLGMHHVPHTGDLPNTVFTTAQSSVLLSPHNYLLNDPSRATSQQVEIKFHGGGGDVAVSTFGSTLPSCTRPDLTVLYPDLHSYQGPQYVRKFPHDESPE